MQLNRTKGTYFTLKLVQKGIFFQILNGCRCHIYQVLWFMDHTHRKEQTMSVLQIKAVASILQI